MIFGAEKSSVIVLLQDSYVSKDAIIPNSDPLLCSEHDPLHLVDLNTKNQLTFLSYHFNIADICQLDFGNFSTAKSVPVTVNRGLGENAEMFPPP